MASRSKDMALMTKAMSAMAKDIAAMTKIFGSDRQSMLRH
jgi:hypothetical protein